MATCSDTSTTISVALAPEEQWLIYQVMLDRMEQEAIAPVETDPPPLSVFRVYEKLETGKHRFTPTELRQIHYELLSYLHRPNLPNQDYSLTKALINRIDGRY